MMIPAMLRHSCRVVLLGLAVVATNGQTFNSGSNGSDGALTLTTPGTIQFDPRTFNPPLDADGDGIYHFTTITVGTGVTVRLSGRVLNGPVIWLATGQVTIDGTLDLTGEQGHRGAYSIPSERFPAYPGAGGFFGGMGGRFGSADEIPAQAGGGPVAGSAAGFSGNGSNGGSGGYGGNSFAVPLIGGSGGGGGTLRTQGTTGAGGGGGGGAILIASSSTIRINGSVLVIGGRGGPCPNCGTSGGLGASGAIRLVATALVLTGLLEAGGGQRDNFPAGGAVRLEGFQMQVGGFTYPGYSTATPSNLFLPTGSLPSVCISNIAGIAAPSNPTGAFDVPDIGINSGAAVPITVEARNIPLGTIVRLRISSENGVDQTIDTTPLAGSVALSTASASAVFPTGFSRGFVRATWTQ